jgi:hypothetical protein
MSNCLRKTTHRSNRNRYDMGSCLRICHEGHMAKRLIKTGCAALLVLIATLGAAQALAASSPPFVDNGDGTVTDTSTGLMWDQCTWGQTGNGSCSVGAANSNLTWTQALGVAATASGWAWKGYSDWRLPNFDELWSLVKTGSTNPSIDTAAFPNTPSSYFWSGTTHAPNPPGAWVVYFYFDGGTGAGNKTNTGYVRLVRSGQYFGAFGLTPSGVSDVTLTTATLTATSAIAATGYWLVVPRNATAPDAAQVIAGVNYGAVTLAAHGSGTMVAKIPATFAVSGLTVSTAYDLYLAAEGSPPILGVTLPTSSVAGPIPFSTAVISTSKVVIDPTTPSTLYAALDGAGVYRSSNSGTLWAAATTQPGNLRVKALVIKPGAPATLFAATYGGGVFKSGDSGQNWTACTSQPSNQNVLTLTMDAATPPKLYAASEGGVFVSSNDCASWAAMNAGLP